ncbi:MAG: TRAP transporter substrate-binding protein [Deltaproteobacteria bacterium]|nr:TRAP transporter substrate-binding protein [Deltaproteobacteria bacterium]
MQKRILTTLLALTVAMVIGSTTAFAAGPIVLKYGHIWPSETRMNKAVLLAAQEIEKNSNGRLKLQVYPGSQLGDQFSEMDNVKTGAQDMTMVYGIDRYCPSFTLFNTPFVFADEKHQYKVAMQSELSEKMVKSYMIEKHNIRLINMLYHGPRMLTTNAARPVKKPGDVKGLKLRTPDITAWIKSWQSIGANVTAFPWDELYLALMQGIVEAQENPLSSIRDMKFYEVQKNIVLTRHIIDYPFVMINEKKYQSLGKELQEVLGKAFEDARQFSLTEGKKEEQANLEFFKQKGLNIVEINKAEWLQAFSKTPELFENGREIYNKIQSVK